MERLEENRRLVRHAVKVVETVTFVVDSIGDEAKTSQLNEALLSLVKGHLMRKIGLAEFRSLGIVLLDFVCQLNQRREPAEAGEQCQQREGQAKQVNKSRESSSSEASNQSSETMTSALDKIRASATPSSLSSSEEDESYLSEANSAISARNNLSTQDSGLGDSGQLDGASKLDTNLLVAAWTKLYGGILDLVRREEEKSEGDK